MIPVSIPRRDVEPEPTCPDCGAAKATDRDRGRFGGAQQFSAVCFADTGEGHAQMDCCGEDWPVHHPRCPKLAHRFGLVDAPSPVRAVQPRGRRWVCDFDGQDPAVCRGWPNAIGVATEGGR